MEGGVEHGHLGHVGAHDGGAGLDAQDVGGVVQGGQGDARLHGGEHLPVDAYGVGEGFAAVDDAVAHCVDLLHGGDDAVFRVH